jgi:hypothetical protein
MGFFKIELPHPFLCRIFGHRMRWSNWAKIKRVKDEGGVWDYERKGSCLRKNCKHKLIEYAGYKPS